MTESPRPYQTPTVPRSYPLGRVWAHEFSLHQANNWLAATFGGCEELAHFDYTDALHGVDNITYPSGIVFLYPEDYVMFKLKFPELISSV